MGLTFLYACGVTVVAGCFVLSVFCWLLCVCPWRFPGMLPLSACGLRALPGVRVAGAAAGRACLRARAAV